MATTYEEVLALFKEVAEAQKETERRFRETDRKFQETERLLRDCTKNQLLKKPLKTLPINSSFFSKTP